MSPETINYLELPARDLANTKAFFTRCFNWQFTDYGPDYTAFNAQGFDGGFFHAPMSSTQSTGGCLIVLYSEDINASLEKVKAHGGIIHKEIFEFPGGKRFHFLEPSGNELAIWSDK
ncbi:VOC family protein [Thalassotalea sp. LPB0316]|uniref:VOC family protein n=1 Tax=Thalassotalea sp. LPB0316 TaxID=2769490 RepID=UPI001866449B|nr:VOC family protein [Thalassotalea sp. LPB0316]QOL24756.1 VOC family protein [Thalassotalea sp. LPB0316]